MAASLPDLTPTHFLLWGVLKDKVCSARPHSIAELKVQIPDAIAQVPLKLCANAAQSLKDWQSALYFMESTCNLNSYVWCCVKINCTLL